MTKPPIYNPNGYCLSCGFKVMTNHTSRTYWFRKEGHQEVAMMESTMGGSRMNFASDGNN
eukprot:14662997-Ditylum_brightwellii.AAC.1